MSDSKLNKKSETKKLKTIEDFLRHVDFGPLEAGNVPVVHPVTEVKIYLPYWQGGRVSEFVFSKKPCVRRDTKNLETFIPSNGKSIRVLKLKIHSDIYEELPNELWRPWKLVLYHDDSPCSGIKGVRLVGGYCPSCKIHPDIQRTIFKAHCPDCDVPLEYELDHRKDYICPNCRYKFRPPSTQ